MKCPFMVEKAGKQTVQMEIIGENYHTALVQRGPVYYYRYRVCMHVSNRYVLLVIQFMSSLYANQENLIPNDVKHVPQMQITACFNVKKFKNPMH